ncbi:hybrid sensor histidine kinase/response regulator [Pedobacter deserti]|uniref:hybrid sensor histidine kinase/response regulator n=1 Tax=Pedobacter deserti TaxID=2817382 RepID=UPI00210A658F|nr:ATP-binding protein [Pedobacter sp. SYSU D00382]
MNSKNIRGSVFYCLLFFIAIVVVFQLYNLSAIHSNQRSAVKLQVLLNLSEEANDNLGSVQQDYRSYLSEPSPAMRATIFAHQFIVRQSLDSLRSLSATSSVLKKYSQRIKEAYMTEEALMTADVDGLRDTDSALRAVVNHELRMDVVWTLLYDYRKIVKGQLQNTNYNISRLAETSRNTGYVLALLALLLTAAFISGKRENKRSAAKLSNDALFMQSLLDTTSTAMHIADQSGRILYVNKSFCEFLGLEANYITGKLFKELHPGRSLNFENPSLRADPHLSPFETEEVVHIDGEKNYFFTRKFPLRDATGQTYAFAIISRNITERILSEEGLRKSREEAEHARLTQEQFMANISHEIRTPMNGVMGMAELLKATPLTEEQAEYVGIISQSSNNLMVLINDVLDFAKIEAGRLELECISFKISEVLNQVLSAMRFKAAERKLNLSLHADHKVPLGVLGDPLRLYQILSNIVSNAIKFTPSGSVTIDVTARSHDSSLVMVIFRITDTGIGIPEDRIDYIFQSFAQTSLDISRKYGGTGLGLAIVKQLVNLYNGQISVSSKLNEGSCFVVEIPFQPAPVGVRTIAEANKFELLKGKSILIVEDNIINQKVIVKTLENSGISTTLCDNGFDALERLKTQRFDAVIMDIQMPEIDGRETTRRIRTELNLDVPVIAMTASVLSDERDRCKAAGMNEYISKPFVKEDLFEKLLLFM